ncbi:DUF4105 domain-containing protein [Aliidiomarina sp. B3213]|uniref:Lnb N-terminal periplasmic domain-containing protein n=1 Tax=Aliidiomarina sp. B3213 TaxID=2249757 RepID=UPI0014038C9C|nr:DUF4105 domain-containing protein [Aliidiomarina sp. B3213]
MRRLVLSLILFPILVSVPAYASDDPYAVIAQSRTWLKLLHVDEPGALSAVNDQRFFLSEQGRQNPYAELRATLAALEAPQIAGEGHAVCKFPARAQFLAQQNLVQPTDANCPERDEWLGKHQDQSVGVMFASGYLGNPASFFGHMLIHLGEPSSNDTPVTLLDTSMNFGADTGDDGIVPYILKGLFGGYQARYSQALFFHNSAIYSESEMRDLWQYKLNLNDEDREFLILHMWEVLGQNFDYLFLSENCASRIARTLELVINDDLAQSNMPWVAPETVMRNLSQAEYEGEPLIAEREHKPSRRLITEHLFHQLTSDQQFALESTWQNPNLLNFQNTAFAELNTNEQGAVIDVILSHLLTLEETDTELPIPQLRQQALVKRLQLPANSQVSRPLPPPPIETAVPSSMWRMAFLDNSEIGTVGRLSFRPLHYDLLQSSAARMPYASLEVLRTDIDITDNNISLNRLQLFDVTNLYVQRTPLPEMRSRAWQVAANISNTHLSCTDCLNFNLDLKTGWSDRFGHAVPYAMAGVQLSTTGFQKGPVAVTATLGMLLDHSNIQRTHIELTAREGFAGEAGRISQLNVEHLLQIDSAFDARFYVRADRYRLSNGEQQKGQELGLAFSYYF